MDRSWMYKKNCPGRREMTNEFMNGVKQFVEFALSHTTSAQIRCPCSKCANEKYQPPETVKSHLYEKGFTSDYFCWTCHGEPIVQTSPGLGSSPSIQSLPLRKDYDSLNPQQRMVFDVGGPSFVPFWAEEENQNADQGNDEDIPSSSTPNVSSDAQPPIDGHENIGLSERFWDVLKAADEPLWSGCENETQLSSVSELLKIKTDFNLSQNCYDRICQWAGRCMPRDHTFPSDYYYTMKLVRELGLSMEKYDICPEGCMLFWKDDAKEERCKFCNSERYKSNPGKKLVPHKQLRYLPLIPRLQRLFALPGTAAEMRWHARRETDEEGIMSHPSDGEAWKHFDKMHPDFASEPRNVRLSLCADGFAPFGQTGKSYSCWPIVVTPYNLPPSMCLKKPYMFLSTVVPGPQNPKKLIDVCLQPLIDELKLLWEKGVPTFDISQKQIFTMRAALLWTINDFPAYGMLSGWSTAGLMACPICMEDTRSFWLPHSRKPCWFDCHRRSLPEDHPFRKNKQAFMKDRVENSPAPQRLSSGQIWNRVKDMPSMTDDPKSTIDGFLTRHKWTKRSIFWDLPYWKTLLIPHNLDVMHIEKNVFDNVFNTVMGVKGKSKDTLQARKDWKTLLIPHNLDVMHIEKNVFDNVFNTVMGVKGKSKDTLQARKDLKEYCNRPSLAVEKDHSGSIPKVVYTLTKNQQREVCNWIKTLKFPDGHASNIGRCVQQDECKLIGMKSHDCHVFMQRLISAAFKEYVPECVWGPLTELSRFFQSVCSPTLSVAQMEEWEAAIPVLLCKLEKVFPPSFFDSMEHVLIHLPYEAKVGGPVQYRWMYPFERFLYHLKKKITNKAHVEASICSSYLVEEISMLMEQYSECRGSSKRRRKETQDQGLAEDQLEHFSIFNFPGRGIGKSTFRWLNDRKENHAIETFILLNCDAVEDFVKIFDNELNGARDEDYDKLFTHWFKNYVKNKCIDDALLNSLVVGPSASVSLWSAYEVNGYTFHTLQRGEGKSTMNSGVWVKGSYSEEITFDFYGLLEEIIQVEYTGLPAKRVVLFKCRWFDPAGGVRVNRKYDTVEVNPKVLYRKDDPFILAKHAIQVYYVSYAGGRGDRAKWRVVCKTRARSRIEHRWMDIPEAYQPDREVGGVLNVDDVPVENLRDPSGEAIDVEDELLDDDNVGLHEYDEETSIVSSSDEDKEIDIISSSDEDFM